MESIHAVVGITIVGLTAIEIMALKKGVNGKMLSTVVGAMALVVGFCFGKVT